MLNVVSSSLCAVDGKIKHKRVCYHIGLLGSKVQLKCEGTQLRTGGEVKGQLSNGVGSRYSSHYLRKWCIQHYYRWCARASSRLNWRLCRFKWNRPFRLKTKSGFCACVITFQTHSTYHWSWEWHDGSKIRHHVNELKFIQVCVTEFSA
jgi:hypothetical protein